jgi:hypothetical protein
MSESYGRKEVHHSREMAGGAWKDVVAELLSSEADRRGAAGAKGGQVPVTFFLSDDGEPHCICVIITTSTSETCICYGQCPDFPDCCDEVPPVIERVE